MSKLPYELGLQLTALHVVTIPVGVLINSSASNFVLLLLFSTGITITFFGCLCVLQGLSTSVSWLRKVAGLAFILLFLATISAVANAIQSEIIVALDNSMTGILLGGAISGFVVGVGALITQKIGGLTSIRLTILGCVLIVVGGIFSFVIIFLLFTH